MLIQRHSVDYWLKNKAIDISIKDICGEVLVHRHEFYEIELILSGGGFYNIDGIDYKIGRGSLFAMSPISFHHINFTENTKLINVMFTLDSCNIEFLSQLFLNEPHFSLTVPESELLFFEEISKQAIENINKTSQNKTLFLSALLDCFLGKVADLFCQNKYTMENTSIQYAILFLQNNFTRKITLNEVAEITNYTPNYFCNQFKNYTGKTFTEYLNDLRFSFALKLLRNTNISVAEICIRCGFNDYSYFVKSFKKHFGTTPKNFRLSNLL